MKTAEELNALKNEVEALNKKLAELTEEELAQVAGGIDFDDFRKDVTTESHNSWNLRTDEGAGPIVNIL